MTRRVLAFLLLLVWLVPAAAAAGTAPPDSGATAATGPPAPRPEEAWHLRGTEQPLARRVTTGQQVLYVLGRIPYAGLEIVARPVVWASGLNERYRLLDRLSRLMIWDLESVDAQVALRFGYETGFGLTRLGVHVTADDWFGTGIDYALTAGYLNPHNALLAFALDTRDEPLSLSLLSRLELKDARPFYGLGQGSPPVRYDAHRRFWLNELILHCRPHPAWELALTGYQRTTDLDQPDDGEPDPDERSSVAQGFPELYAAAVHSGYRGVELRLTWSAIDPDALCAPGALVSVVGGWNGAYTAVDPDYRHYSLDLRFQRPLWRHSRGVAVRLFAEGVDCDRPDRLPYTEMPVLGGRYDLRGFPRDRFRDTHAVLASVEYRYPVLAHVQGRLFHEWGMVAPRWRDIRGDDLASSTGLALGIQVEGETITVQYARSREGGHLYIGTTGTFELHSRRLR